MHGLPPLIPSSKKKGPTGVGGRGGDIILILLRARPPDLWAIFLINFHKFDTWAGVYTKPSLLFFKSPPVVDPRGGRVLPSNPYLISPADGYIERRRQTSTMAWNNLSQPSWKAWVSEGREASEFPRGRYIKKF